MLLAVPPALLVVVMTLVGVSLDTAIRVIVWLGAASLGLWGGLAAHRAGLRGRRVVVVIVAGFVVGGAVLALQVFLQPGRPVANGHGPRSSHPSPRYLAVLPLPAMTLSVSSSPAAQ